MVKHAITLEDNEITGPRLKYHSMAADVEYWTTLWEADGARSYQREQAGHLPHQLRATFARWVSPGAKVLEAGCGLGHFTVAANALGYHAEGLDWSEETVQRLRHKFPEITWHHGDVRALTFENESFDALYSPGVCEHFEEGPVQILCETRRVLRAGGTAVISTPCLNTWLEKRARQLFPQEHAEAKFYQYAFTPEGMTRLLERLGFDVLQVRPYASLTTMLRYSRWWRVPQTARAPLSWLLDQVPGVNQRGSTCLWVARKR